MSGRTREVMRVGALARHLPEPSMPRSDLDRVLSIGWQALQSAVVVGSFSADPIQSLSNLWARYDAKTNHVALLVYRVSALYDAMHASLVGIENSQGEVATSREFEEIQSVYVTYKQGFDELKEAWASSVDGIRGYLARANEEIDLLMLRQQQDTTAMQQTMTKMLTLVLQFETRFVGTENEALALAGHIIRFTDRSVRQRTS
jgi:hypothetical protein